MCICLSFCAIIEQHHSTRIILFGSFAYGKPTPDSDVDSVDPNFRV